MGKGRYMTTQKLTQFCEQEKSHSSVIRKMRDQGEHHPQQYRLEEESCHVPLRLRQNPLDHNHLKMKSQDVAGWPNDRAAHHLYTFRAFPLFRLRSKRNQPADILQQFLL